MDLELVIEHVNKLSQQVSFLHEYIQLKFGTDFKEFYKWKEANPKLFMVVVQQGHPFTEEDDDDAQGLDGNDAYTEWDKGLTPRVTNVYKLEEEVEEVDFQIQPHPPLPPSSWSNNIDDNVDNDNERHDGELPPPDSEDFFVDKSDPDLHDDMADDDDDGDADAENGVDFSTDEIEFMPALSPPVLDWMGHSNGVVENGHDDDDDDGESGEDVDVEPEERVNVPITKPRPKIKRPRPPAGGPLSRRPVPIKRRIIYPAQEGQEDQSTVNGGVVVEEEGHIQEWKPMQNITKKKKPIRPRKMKVKFNPKFNLPTVMPKLKPRLTQVGDLDPYRHAQFGLLYRMSDRGEKMVVNEYFFRVNKHDKKSGKTYWVCVDKTCPVRIAQDIVGRPSQSRDSEHTHPPQNPADMRLLDA